MSNLRLGLVVDSVDKQQALVQLISQCGHQLGAQLMLTADSQCTPNSDLDAWVIDVAAENCDDSYLLEQLYSQRRVPVLLSDSGDFDKGGDEHKAWLRRTSQRLQRLSGDINLQQADPASDFWILAASTGGPAAVKRFLSELPGDLGVAFMYVQHIDTNHTATLNRMMTTGSQYTAMIATQGAVLERNSLTLVTARDKVEILENGTIDVSYDQPWNGSYAPSIDQITANAARIYRDRCGLIVFTGMGDDGSASGRLVKQQGGRVWAQTPTDCTVDSMPVCAIATGCVSLTDTPEMLAKALVRLQLT